MVIQDLDDARGYPHDLRNLHIGTIPGQYIYVYAIMQHSTGTARSVGTLYFFHTFDILCNTKLELPTHVHVIQLRNLPALDSFYTFSIVF